MRTLCRLHFSVPAVQAGFVLQFQRESSAVSLGRHAVAIARVRVLHILSTCVDCAHFHLIFAGRGILEPALVVRKEMQGSFT